MFLYQQFTMFYGKPLLREMGVSRVVYNLAPSLWYLKAEIPSGMRRLLVAVVDSANELWPIYGDPSWGFCRQMMNKGCLRLPASA